VTALAGLWNLGGRVDPAGSLARMLQAQRVYAPDAPASWSDGRIALGRRLWTLLPEDRFDRGPVISQAGTLIADLRLDNRDELGDALGIGPADAKALSDAALLMKALERWGDEAVDRLVGEFAFAWWDAREQRLVLARDPLGHRPLHFHRGDGFFAFASMPKGLHALPEIPYGPDRRAVASFLALVPETGSETFFEGIEKVCSAEIAIVTRNGMRSRRWWDPRPAPLILPSAGDYAEAMRAELDRAVAVRLRGADGRVASHLSGGLDSTAIAATAARQLGPSGGKVTGFTAVPRPGSAPPPGRDNFYDEGPLAAAVADLYPNMEQVTLATADRSPTADLARHFFLYERPFLNLCNGVWMHASYEAAKARRLTIFLTGQYGNASFSYDGMAFLHQLLRQGRLLRLGSEAARLYRGGTRLGTIAAQVLGPLLPDPVWNGIGRLRGGDRSLASVSSLTPERAAAHGVYERAEERGLDLNCRPRRDPIEARLWMVRRVDSGNYRKGALAGWGVDLREPAGDRRLIEFCLSVPVEQFLLGGSRRSLARRAFADRLPAEVAGERRKGLQAVDWLEGLTAARAEVAEEVEAIAECGPAADTVDSAMLRRLVEDWPAKGSWNERAVVSGYRLALLRGISAGRFIRQASGSNR
jgi:asparagine synthase (glutamine-hydrolysing)